MPQKLSPKALKAKRKRDLAAANTPRRRKMRAECQKARRAAAKKHGKDWLKGKDYDHNTKRFVSTSYNRGGTQSRKKKDGTKAERKQNKNR
tara:strand:+ start:746 stop:1018 length:273 start_codon:yes stop_codon:yes gene_type:complete